MQQQKSSIAQHFAESLRSARGSRSQAEFARYLGIKHQQTYQAYESGRVPDGETLHQISLKLGVTIDALLSSESQAEASGKKVFLALNETPWGKELEEDTQMTIAIGLLCRRLTSVELFTITQDVLKSRSLTDKSKLFWVKIFSEWAFTKADLEEFEKLSPEEKIRKHKADNEQRREARKTD